jgi:transcriptional regulator with XRE-family HTH domain
MGLTVTELARMLDVSPAAISAWERKKKSVLRLQGWSRKALRRAWEAAM